MQGYFSNMEDYLLSNHKKKKIITFIIYKVRVNQNAYPKYFECKILLSKIPFSSSCMI